MRIIYDVEKPRVNKYYVIIQGQVNLKIFIILYKVYNLFYLVYYQKKYSAMSHLVHTQVSWRTGSVQPVTIGRTLVLIILSLRGIEIFNSKCGRESSINYKLFRLFLIHAIHWWINCSQSSSCIDCRLAGRNWLFQITDKPILFNVSSTNISHVNYEHPKHV